MKKRRLALLPAIIVVLSLALVLTKPETALHFTTLNNMVKSVVDHEIKKGVESFVHSAFLSIFVARKQQKVFLRDEDTDYQRAQPEPARTA